jgi:hypothetical protein
MGDLRAGIMHHSAQSCSIFISCGRHCPNLGDFSQYGILSGGLRKLAGGTESPNLGVPASGTFPGKPYGARFSGFMCAVFASAFVH